MMRKVVQLDTNSTLRLFIVFYAVVGLYATSKAVIVGDDTVVCPFGFAFPLTNAFITVTLHLPHPATWLTTGVIFIATVFYALTGLISGGAVILVYNVVGKFWPLFSAQVEEEQKSAPIESKMDAPMSS